VLHTRALPLPFCLCLPTTHRLVSLYSAYLCAFSSFLVLPSLR